MRAALTAGVRLLRPLGEPCLRAVADRQVQPGDTHICEFAGRARHHWDQLPDGREVDLASEPFGGDGFRPLVAGEPIEVPSPNPLTALLFAPRVMTALTS